jgi:hypothetical protein
MDDAASAMLADLFSLPETPADMFARSPALQPLLASLPVDTVALLSGMMADPRWQANVERLEILARASVALSRGAEAPSRDQLNALLNTHAHESRITRLEDPPEDPFAARIVTDNGEYVAIGGGWDHAAFTIEVLIAASGAAPESEIRDQAIGDAGRLLRIAHDVARAAGVEPGKVGGGVDAGDLRVPRQREQRRLRSIVSFDAARLAGLNITASELAPFIARPKQHRGVLKKKSGATVFDRKPLLQLDDGTLIVVSPGALLAALRLRLAQFARDAGAPYFQRALLRTALERIDETRLMRVPAQIPAQQVSAFAIKNACVEIEPGRWVHIFAVADSFAPGDIQKPAKGARALSKMLARSIRWAHAKAKESDYRQGLTLLIGCGWGRAMKMWGPGRLPRGWRMCAADCADFATIGSNQSGHVIDLWRLLVLEQIMARRGYRLGYLNGVLNLFSWWIENSHQLVPEHAIEIGPGDAIMLSPGEVAAARVAAQERLGSRSIPLPVGGLDRVLRKQADSFFPNAHGERQYASIGAVREKALMGVVDAAAPCWVLVDPHHSVGSLNWQYQVWDAVMDWAARLIRVLEDDGGAALPKAPYSVRVRVIESEQNWGETPEPGDCTPQQLSPFVDASLNCIVITCGPDWNAYLQCEDNVAERALVGALAEGMAELARADIDSFAIANRTVGGTDARHLRAVAANNACDIIGSRSKRFDAISASASSLAKTNLDTLLGGPAPGRRIEGVEACVSALHLMVAVMGRALSKAVRTFDRAKIIQSALEASQSATFEEGAWRRSYRAQYGLHGDTPDVRRVAYEQTLRINAVRMGSRIITEMAAAQTRPKGRLVPGRADMIELMTAASTMLHMAELSNEIEAGLTPASITFSPGGDVLSRRDFTDAIQTPMSRMMSDAHVDFEIARRNGPANEAGAGAIDDEFRRAVEAEYGVPLEALVEIPQTLSTACLEENAVSIVLSRAIVESLIARDADVSKEAARHALDRLVLPMRASWARPPKGFARKDIDPWRFGRRLALAARPIVQLSRGEDEELLCAPAVIEEAIRYQVNCAWEGRLPQPYWTSSAMRSWTGRAGRKLGEAFNADVAADLEARGLKALANRSPGWLASTKNQASLGDIDVVAWRPGGQTLWVIEAKDLGLTRTAAEVADRIRDFSPGERAPGKKTKLQRHLNRLAFVREHQGAALAKLGLPSSATIRGAVIFSAPQPMMFAAPPQEDARCYLIGALAEAIAGVA